MSAKTAVFEILNAHASLTAVTGARIQARETPPSTASPRVVVRRTGTNWAGDCLDEANTCGPRVETFAFACYASTDLAADSLASLVEDAIEAINTETTYDGIRFSSVEMIDRRDGDENAIYEMGFAAVPDIVVYSFTYEHGCE